MWAEHEEEVKKEMPTQTSRYKQISRRGKWMLAMKISISPCPGPKSSKNEKLFLVPNHSYVSCLPARMLLAFTSNYNLRHIVRFWWESVVGEIMMYVNFRVSYDSKCGGAAALSDRRLKEKKWNLKCALRILWILRDKKMMMMIDLSFVDRLEQDFYLEPDLFSGEEICSWAFCVGTILFFRSRIHCGTLID